MVFLLCAVLLLTLLIIKVLIKLTCGQNGSYTCLVGKTAIVTGANSGIGFYTAQDFASRGANVILACRNKDKAAKARQRIIENTGNSNVVVEIIDFASLKSVRDFANRIKTTENRLYILVNNAGLLMFDDVITEDGLSMSMQVNYLGPFLLTTLLLDLLQKSQSSRIVNVSSKMAHHAQLKPDNLNYFATSLTSNLFYTNYANTKLCIILWTNELARRLKGTNITVNSLHPGVIHTGISQNISTVMWYMYKLADWLFLKNVIEGAQTTIYAAVSKDIESVTGKYFQECKIANQPKLAIDTSLAKKIWETSEDLVKLTPDERNILFTL